VDRWILFLFLVVAVPSGVYWASHDFERIGRGVARFRGELGEMRGTPPPEETEDAPAAEPEPDEPEPEPEPEPRAEPEPEPEPEPQPEPEPAETPHERGERAFREGRFAEAADLFSGIDPVARGLAELGAAFKRAFPKDLPDRPYGIARTGTGAEFEGFVERRGGLLKLVGPTGRTVSFQETEIHVRKTIPAERVPDHIATKVLEEGGKTKSGPRLFALLLAACRAGRADAIGTLLPRALELDEEEPYFLSSIRHRVAPEYQNELFRAFTAAQAPHIVEDAPIVKVPRRLGDPGGRARPRRRVGNESDVDDSRARKLLAEAAPLRRDAMTLYRKVRLAGLDGARPRDVDRAIELFDRVLAKYEKALVIEDSDTVAALARQCSKVRFTLGFMRQQLEGR